MIFKGSITYGKKRNKTEVASAVCLCGASARRGHPGLGVLILFYVQEIEVDGNEYCTDQQIVDTVKNDKYSINTLYILAKYAVGKGESLPCLDSIKVSLKAPWALKVKVEEKPIVGYVENEDHYAYFDQEGMVVSESTALIEGLPCIEGISMKDIKLYGQLEVRTVKFFRKSWKHPRRS